MSWPGKHEVNLINQLINDNNTTTIR